MLKMKYIERISLFMMLVVSFLVTLGSMKVYADSSESAYSVSANIPSFQSNQKLSYFDLQLKPKQKETISIHLTNNSQENAVYLVNVNNAATNSNGVIDYNQTDFKQDPSANYVLKQMVTPVAQEVSLAAGESKDVSFQITMPDQAFKGIVLGGIHVTKKDTISKKVAGTAIRNKYAYVIGVKLRNTEDQIVPDLKLRSAKAGLQNSYTTIFANLQNPTPTIISKVSIDAKITRKGSKKILYETKKESLAIAPNTNFDFPVSLNKRKIAAGEYTVTIDAKEGQTNHSWHLTKDFTIKADKAKKINNEAVIEDQGIPYLPIIIGVGILLVLVILILSYKLLKKKSR